MNLASQFSPNDVGPGHYTFGTGDSPGLITKSSFYWELIRPPRCEPGETVRLWPPGVEGPFSLLVFSVSTVLSQEKSPASGSAFWKAQGDGDFFQGW